MKGLTNVFSDGAAILKERGNDRKTKRSYVKGIWGDVQ